MATINTFEVKKEEFFRKPAEICKSLSDKENELIMLNDADFICAQKKEIEEELNKYGYSIREATYDDVDPLLKFTDKWYVRLEGNELSAYDYYRFLKFGTGLILENEEEILACVFEIAYYGKPPISYPLRLVLDDKVKGNNFGQLLVLYLSLTAKARGAEINRSVISYDNHISLYIQLNKQGWILNGVNPNIKGLTNYFEACLPLTKTGLMLNKIDKHKIIEYINSHTKGVDYLLLETEDLEKVQQAFNKEYIIAAFVREGIVDEKNYFFALPAKTIGFQMEKSQHH